MQDTYHKYHLSFTTGFLPENPLTAFPADSQNWPRHEYLKEIDAKAYELPLLIRKRGVRFAIEHLPIPDWPVDDLSRHSKFRLQFLCAMLMHAHSAEVVPRDTVTGMLEKGADYSVPSQIGIPLWKLSQITGIAPSMSYELYSPWNYRLLDPAKEISLDNLDLIHSFTGTLDEKWFVWIHQVVDLQFTGVLESLLGAYFITYHNRSGDIDPKTINGLLEESIAGLEKMLNTLERMREHCGPGVYFNIIRKFYTIPQNFQIPGVPEIEGQRFNILGETGGQDPWKQFVHAVLGMDFDDIEFRGIKYFPEVRRNMSYPRRELIEKVKQTSRLRDYIIFQQQIGNMMPLCRYNSLVQLLIDWMKEHFSLAQEYVNHQGEQHGTAKIPFIFLEDLKKQTQFYLIN